MANPHPTNKTPPVSERGRGRPKGAKNKIPSNAKAALESVFDGLGGTRALKKWASENPTDFYSKLWVKILPAEVKGELNVTGLDAMAERLGKALERLK